MKRLLKMVPAGSVILASTAFSSYVLGLLRDRLFAQTFGATRVLDAYNAAFLIPDLLFNILIAGGIAAAFVPILTELLRTDTAKAEEYINSVISAATSTMLIIAVLILIFAGPISVAVAPGFGAEDRLLVAKILRILALSPIFFGASNALGALLITKQRFLFYGLSPIVYNLGIILGTVFLVPSFGIMGVAIGTVIGALFHLAVRAYDARRQGLKFYTAFAFSTPEFRKTLRLMVPKMFGHPVELATFWGFTAIASTLTHGSVSVLNFARNFQSVPVSLIGITIATTSFPLLAGAMSDNSIGVFWKRLQHSILLITAGSVVAAITIFILSKPLISIFLGGGAFTDAAIDQTAMALAVFCLSIPTESLVHLLARAFYATKNTTIPVVINILALMIAIPGGYIFSRSYGVLGLPLAFFLSSFTELVVLGVLLLVRVRRLGRV